MEEEGLKENSCEEKKQTQKNIFKPADLMHFQPAVDNIRNLD